jgi:hypothetical protein
MKVSLGFLYSSCMDYVLVLLQVRINLKIMNHLDIWVEFHGAVQECMLIRL